MTENIRIGPLVLNCAYQNPACILLRQLIVESLVEMNCDYNRPPTRIGALEASGPTLKQRLALNNMFKLRASLEGEEVDR